MINTLQDNLKLIITYLNGNPFARLYVNIEITANISKSKDAKLRPTALFAAMTFRI